VLKPSCRAAYHIKLYIWITDWMTVHSTNGSHLDPFLNVTHTAGRFRWMVLLMMFKAFQASINSCALLTALRSFA
jgi:hypothetical protein